MLSMAATVATSRIFAGFLSDEPLTALMHGPTYMANPTACAAANASLDLFESEPRLEQARAMEAMMGELLVPCRRHPEVIDVRCRGGVGVVQVASLRDLDWLRAELVRAGVWLRPFGDMVYMTPPLTIQPGQLQQLCEATVDVLRRW
jgi:adenosylmethionine-8-amino-7-oxononanoate aminotransferase